METFSRFAEWLETAAIAPANKASFWARLFGRRPTRPPFDRPTASALSADLRAEIAALREVLFSEDDAHVEIATTTSDSEARAFSGEVGANVGPATVGVSSEKTLAKETSEAQTTRYTRNKMQHLQRHILDYQKLFNRMAQLSAGDAFLFLDDLYHIPRKHQAQVVDYLHRVAKGNSLWLKIGTIRHRTQWYIHGDPPIGAKIGDDIAEIDLDLTLEKYRITSAF